MAGERKTTQATQDGVFVKAWLPWILAAAVFLVYALTVDHWISFSNLQPVANVAGYNWLPELLAPVSFLLTLPFRAAPARLVPIALNLFAALCGAAAMGLLARSVALLPHDRTQEQRDRHRSPSGLLSIRTAWLPPVVAVIACALELSVWEYSTSARTWSQLPGGIEVVDLLMFAYILRCLLEFRVSQKESWAYKASLVYGAAIANNWAMFSFSPPFVSFFPLFIGALIWIRGLAFFNVRFLVRMLLLGLAGLSLYLLLPIYHATKDSAGAGFWGALFLELKSQRWVQGGALTKFHIFNSDKPLWVTSLYSFIPILALSIRWPSYFGDTSKLGQAIATITFHLVHAAFLLLCMWVALDSPISPRNHAPWLPLLTLNYLSALSIGYLVGYFLLVFSPPPASSRRPDPALGYLNYSVRAFVICICVLLPCGLLYRNLPAIRISNGPMYRQYAALTALRLPKEDTVIMSDDRNRLVLLQAYASQQHRTNLIFLDTASLKIPEYHRQLHRKYGDRWPTNPGKEVTAAADPLKQLEILFALSASNSLYYIHPSFGYYFELFDLEPHGMTYKLLRPDTNAPVVSTPTPQLVRENDLFWNQDALPALDSVTAAGTIERRERRSIADKIFKALRLQSISVPEARGLGEFYSRSLDYWAVQVQTTGDLPGAANFFNRALLVNSDNIVATVNLNCNRLLQEGKHLDVGDPQSVLDQFGRYRSWDAVMNENGPYDEPTFCFAEGVQLANNSLFRQAIRQFERVKVLAPTFLPARLWLANIYLLKKLPDQTLKVLDEIKADPNHFPSGRTNLSQMVYLRASALLLKEDRAAADTLINSTLREYPNDPELLQTAVHIYMNNLNYSNAIPLIDRQLAANPTNTSLMMNKGFACLQAGKFDEAIATLNRILNSETNSPETHDTALLNRAIAYLRSGKLDEAQKDYETLQRSFPTAYRIFYGLGDIAYQRHDTNAAIRNYQLYLTNAPSNLDEITNVTARLKELRPGYP